MESTLQNFFYPRNIVIVGASAKKGSIGHELTASILNYGFKGEIYLTHPSAVSILGINCYKNVEEIKTELDLAIIMVPKVYVEDTIQSCLSAGVKSFILITAGFRETGKEGEIAERNILSRIQGSGGRLVGPNCMGIINTLSGTSLNATFVAEHPEEGKSAFLSQSGALGAAVLNSLRETGITFAHFISVGNKADISENDLLEFWQADPNIKVITLYLESFSDGNRFLKLFSEKKITKPVIVLKAGKTDAGMKAASSHTGALGSSDRSVDSIFEQFGIIRVNNLNDLFNTAKGFESFPIPAGDRIAVVTNAGGPAILAVDQIGSKGLKLAELSSDTRSMLKNIVHPEGSINNPVDLLPGGTAETYKSVVEIITKDNEVDSVIVIFVEPVMVKPLEVVQKINSVISEKPVFTVVMPLPEFWDLYKKECPHSEPLFRNPEDPAEIIRNMLKYRNFNRGSERITPRLREKATLPSEGFLSHEIVIKLAEIYNLPLVENKILNPEQLSEINSGFPFVLKAGGKGIVHKSELRGVELNLRTKEELLNAAENIKHNFSQKGLDIEHFILQPFISTKFEILIGGFRDPDFGPMVMFGTGGKYVEFYKDISVRSALLSDLDVDEMLNSTVMGKLLKGVRGESESCVSEIKKTLFSVAQLMVDYNEISEIDLNPLIVDKNNKLFTVDIRIKVK